MPKKDDVSIVRAREFQQVDEDLTSAMEDLDAANLRIAELLNGTEEEVEPTAAEDVADEGKVSDQDADEASPDDETSSS